MSRMLGRLLLALSLVGLVGLGALTTEALAAEATMYENGGFDETNTDDDWFYDYYEADFDPNYFENDWADYTAYEGYYDDDLTNDWFYDAYDDPGEEGLFDL